MPMIERTTVERPNELRATYFAKAKKAQKPAVRKPAPAPKPVAVDAADQDWSGGR
jgi:hypothetical protein